MDTTANLPIIDAINQEIVLYFLAIIGLFSIWAGKSRATLSLLVEGGDLGQLRCQRSGVPVMPSGTSLVPGRHS